MVKTLKTKIFHNFEKIKKKFFRKHFRFGLKIVQLLIKFQKNCELRKNLTFKRARSTFWEGFREKHHIYLKFRKEQHF